MKIGTLITTSKKENLISLLREYVDVFAWSYMDIFGLDTNIVVHKVPLNERSILVKQKLQRTCPNIVLKVKAKIASNGIVVF